MSGGSTTEYVQRKLPASGVTLTDTGSNPALAGVATAAATRAAANRRAIEVRRIMWSSSVKGDSGRATGDRAFRPHSPNCRVLPPSAAARLSDFRAAGLDARGFAVNADSLQLAPAPENGDQRQP